MKFKKSSGLIQIPLLIGLLLMAVAIPVVTRLVQNNQENRSKAALAEPCKECVGKACTIVATAPNCMPSENACNTNADCGGPTATKIPTNPPATATKVPPATPTNVPPTAVPTKMPTETPGTGCNALTSTGQSANGIYGETSCYVNDLYQCAYNHWTKIKTCAAGYICKNDANGAGHDDCVVVPTPTIINPQGTCTGSCKLGTIGKDVRSCATYGMVSATGQCYYAADICCKAAPPTETPSTGCNALTSKGQSLNGVYGEQSCVYNDLYQCAYNNWTKIQTCPTGQICKNDANGVGHDACVVAPPTAVPSTGCNVLTSTGQSANGIYGETSCYVNDLYQCAYNHWTKIQTCPTGQICKNDANGVGHDACVPVVSLTPTKVPTATPTKVPTATPTKVPTATPIPGTKGCGTACQSGVECKPGLFCTSNNGMTNVSICWANSCSSLPTATPTVCQYGGCQSEGTQKCTSNTQYFCDGSCWNLIKTCGTAGCNGNICQVPSPTLTTRPGYPTNTPVPTSPPGNPTTPPGNPTTPPGNPTTPPTSMCTECPSDFKCYTNGSEKRWFVTGYVMQGFVPSPDSTCGVARPTFLGKQKGDANCDGSIDVLDFSLWHKEFFDGSYGATDKKTWSADFTGSNGVCDGKVDIYDFSLWQKFFNELK